MGRKACSWTCSAWTWTHGPGPKCKCPFLRLLHLSISFFAHLLTSGSLPSDVSASRSPLGRSMLTMTSISDHTLFVYGGLGVDGNTLSESPGCSPQLIVGWEQANEDEDVFLVCVVTVHHARCCFHVSHGCLVSRLRGFQQALTRVNLQ